MDCVQLVCILSVLYPLIGLSNLTGFQYLVATDRQSVYSASVVIGTIINIIANLILIPRLSAVGAALATVLSEFVVLAVQLAFLILIKREFSMTTVFGGSLRYIIGSLIMVPAIFFIEKGLGGGVLSLIAQTFTGAFIYFAWLVISRDDLTKELLMSLVNRLLHNRRLNQ